MLQFALVGFAAGAGLFASVDEIGLDLFETLTNRRDGDVGHVQHPNFTVLSVVIKICQSPASLVMRCLGERVYDVLLRGFFFFHFFSPNTLSAHR